MGYSVRMGCVMGLEWDFVEGIEHGKPVGNLTPSLQRGSESDPLPIHLEGTLYRKPFSCHNSWYYRCWFFGGDSFCSIHWSLPSNIWYIWGWVKTYGSKPMAPLNFTIKTYGSMFFYVFFVPGFWLVAIWLHLGGISEELPIIHGIQVGVWLQIENGALHLTPAKGIPEKWGWVLYWRISWGIQMDMYNTYIYICVCVYIYIYIERDCFFSFFAVPYHAPTPLSNWTRRWGSQAFAHDLKLSWDGYIEYTTVFNGYRFYES